MLRPRTSALLLSAVLVVYLAATGWRAVLLLRDGRPLPVVLGLGLLVLPLLGAWTLWRELAFGRATQALARELEAAGGLPPDDAPRTPSGRVDRARAQEWFVPFRRAVEDAPQDWGGWFRLACAYDVAGDRRRARAAMRHAVGLRAAAPAPDRS